MTIEELKKEIVEVLDNDPFVLKVVDGFIDRAYAFGKEEERKRCAEIAREYEEETVNGGGKYAADKIASAIESEAL